MQPLSYPNEAGRSARLLHPGSRVITFSIFGFSMFMRYSGQARLKRRLGLPDGGSSDVWNAAVDPAKVVLHEVFVATDSPYIS